MCEQEPNASGTRRPSTVQLMRSAVFRAHQHYELVMFDRLPPHEQDALRELQDQPDFYGILRPVAGASLGIKSVSRDTALLYLTLREPGPLPAYMQTLAKESFESVVLRLLCDNVLEMQVGNEFVSGAQAYARLHARPLTACADGAHRLSIDALRYAQHLHLPDVQALSMRLYSFNRLPVSTKWKKRFPDSAAVAAHLGIDQDGANRARLDKYWISATEKGEPADGWYAWNRRDQHGRTVHDERSWKLYVSPHPDALREVFEITLDVLSAAPVRQFKVGADVYGVLRPDKLVAYFGNFDDLRAVAETLDRRAGGHLAQGVPFSAQIGESGLLSWGVDPPESQQLLSWQPRESWRLWLTNRLAHALHTAATAPTADLEPWEFALERLRLDGIDTDAWIARETTH